MDEKIREEIAQFRYSLIGPIVSRTNLSHGEKYEILRKISNGEYEIPYSNRRKVGLRTLERYLNLYEKDKLKALEPGFRHRSQRIPAQYMEEAVNLRRENRHRSIESIISMLEQSGRIPEGVLKRSTVYDHFVKFGIARKQTAPKEAYRKFGATYRGEILQGDVHHTMYLPDPVREGYNRQVYLFGWIDDFTRLFYGEFYWAEKLPALENTLKKWIIKYSCPVNCYCDNGAVFSSHHLKNICGRLGINLLHSRPYKPMGRGKIEKIFQLVESSFKSEAVLLVKDGRIKTLEDLNSYFSAWVDKFYNQRLHSSTKQKPIAMWGSGENELKKPSLAGKKVQARYDPYDLSAEVQVYHEGKRYQDAIPAVVRRHHKKNFVGAQDEAAIYTGINHLELLKNESMKEIRGISFAQAMDKGGCEKI